MTSKYTYAELGPQSRSSLVGYWRMNEAMTDLSMVGNDGTYHNGPLLNRIGALQTSSLADSLDTAAQFNSVNHSYASLPHNAAYNFGQQFTLMGWIKLDGLRLVNSRGILSKGFEGLYIRVEDEGKIQVVSGGAHILAYSNVPVPNDGTFHHFAVVQRSAFDFMIVVDGVPITGPIGGEYEYEDNTNDFYVGSAAPAAEEGDFDLDELQLYNEPLELAEIRRDFRLGHGPVEPQVYKLGFESGDYFGWSLAGEGEVEPKIVTSPVHSGTYASKHALVGEENRSEIILGGSGTLADDGVIISDGDFFIYRFHVFIPTGKMTYGFPGAHNLFMQFKGEGEGSPEFAIQLWDDKDFDKKGKGLWVSADYGGTEGFQYKFQSLIAEGEWHEVEVHILASSHKVGSWSVRLDGKLLAELKNVNTLVNGKLTGYIKDGLYRNGETIGGDGELVIDDAELILTPGWAGANPIPPEPEPEPEKEKEPPAEPGEPPNQGEIEEAEEEESEGGKTEPDLTRFLDMLAQLPPFMRNDPTTRSLHYVVSQELDGLEATIDRMIRNFYPQTADIFLEFWENLFGLPISPEGKTQAQRRQTVITFLRRLSAGGAGENWLARVTDLLGSGWEYIVNSPLGARGLVWDRLFGFDPDWEWVVGGPQVSLLPRIPSGWRSLTGFSSRAFRTGIPTSEDQEVCVQFQRGESGTLEAIIKKLDPENYLVATWAAGVLQTSKKDGGATSALGGAGTTAALADDQMYWLRAAIEGNVFVAEIWESDPTKQNGDSAIFTKSTTLAGANATKYGGIIPGGQGIGLATPVGEWIIRQVRIDQIGFSVPANTLRVTVPYESDNARVLEIGLLLRSITPANTEIEIFTDSGFILGVSRLGVQGL